MEAVEAELARIQADFPQFKITKVYDRATPVAEDYHSSLDMLIEGGILAVAVVFVFLRIGARRCLPPSPCRSR